MGYSRAIEDLTVSKNTNGKKVSWTYEGNKPKGYVAHDIYGHDYTYCHQTAPEILVSDADLLNEICWSVANPEGAYTVNIYSLIETAALLMSDNSSKNNIITKYEYTPWDRDGDNNFSHQLLEPFRARQTWRMNIIIDEWENGIVTGAQSEIDNYLKDSYPALYAHEFTICDKTPTSVEVISSFIDYSKSIFDYNYDILQGLAHSYGVKQFTIHWRCDDTNVTVKEGYTVKVDGSTGEQPLCRQEGQRHPRRAPVLQERLVELAHAALRPRRLRRHALGGSQRQGTEERGVLRQHHDAEVQRRGKHQGPPPLHCALG